MSWDVEFQGTSKDFGNHDGYLCTNTGMNDLDKWIESLPEAEYPSLYVLSREGEYTNTRRLFGELRKAVEASPPPDPDTREVAETLLDLIMGGEENETITFS
jgi:hypothetical protein